MEREALEEEKVGSGYGSVGRAVASDNRGLQFESSFRGREVRSG